MTPNQYPVLGLHPKKERALINRHPWVFSGAVKQIPKADNGDIVAVADASGKVLGYGFFSPQSQICCRVFEFDSTEEPVFDLAYWAGKIQRAFSLRRQWIGTNTTCYRLIHAEGDFFPGVIADVYQDTVVLQLLIKGSAILLDTIAEVLYGLGFKYIYIKNKQSSHFLEGLPQESFWYRNESPALPIEVYENELRFTVNPEKGQKTGFFIDQRESRALLGSVAQGKRVLNTFSYTGGFSLYALAGGASEVHSVDISKDAIEMCIQHIDMNGFGERHQGIAADCFNYLRHTREEYDIIVLDPPAFAKNARSVPNAARGYKDLNLLAFKIIKPGGLVFTYSCSQNIDKDLFQKIVFSAAADSRRNVRIVKHLGQPPDHPVNIYHPESEYLKGLMLWVE